MRLHVRRDRRTLSAKEGGTHMSRLAFLAPLVLGFTACLDSTQPLGDSPAAARPELSVVANITTLDLGTLGGNFSIATALNAAGQVAGISNTASGDLDAFLWDGTTMRSLGTVAGDFIFPIFLNAAGQVAGNSNAASGADRAFFWDGTSMRDLGTLGGNSSIARALNGAGQVAGISNTASGDFHAFFWDGTTMRDLG